MGVTPVSAAERLLSNKEALAQAITAELYWQLPQLQEKYGARGREKCLQDMRYNLEHLAPAVDLAEPGMFAGYVRWLDGLLRARGVATTELARSLEITRQQIGALVAESAMGDVDAAIDAGLAELKGDAR